jgi:hypothetical protein
MQIKIQNYGTAMFPTSFCPSGIWTRVVYSADGYDYHCARGEVFFKELLVANFPAGANWAKCQQSARRYIFCRREFFCRPKNSFQKLPAGPSWLLALRGTTINWLPFTHKCTASADVRNSDWKNGLGMTKYRQRQKQMTFLVLLATTRRICVSSWRGIRLVQATPVQK